MKKATFPPPDRWLDCPETDAKFKVRLIENKNENVLDMSSSSSEDDQVSTRTAQCSSLARTTLQAEWGQGHEVDFVDLREAISSGRALKFDGKAKETSSEEEDDDPEKLEPPREAPGRRLLWAAQFGRTDTLRELLDSEPTLVGYSDDDGYTALHRACYMGREDVVAELLVRDAPLEAVTVDGWTPLHSAARWNSAGCATVLLENGVDVNARTNGGQTPLHLAAVYPRPLNIMEVLFMQEDLDLSIRNAQGDTAKDIARRNRNGVALFELFDEEMRP